MTLSRETNHDEGLIRPTKRKADPGVGPDAIMAMIPSGLDFLVKTSHAKKVPLFDMNFYHLYQYRAKLGTKVLLTLLGPFLGAPQAVMAMEKMIALGAKRVWVIGWCGSLQKNLRIGDLLIPTDALSEEGTSQHYPIGEKISSTDEKLNQILEEALQKRAQNFRRGTVWTTDALYRETPAKIKEYQAKGVMAVEMEMSALMTLAIYRKVKLGALLVVSDELFELKWHTGFSSPKLKQASRYAGELIMGLVTSKNK